MVSHLPIGNPLMADLFSETRKSGDEAFQKADKSVPLVAKSNSNFLLNRRTGFYRAAITVNAACQEVMRRYSPISRLNVNAGF
jgi:hypothetical protein